MGRIPDSPEGVALALLALILGCGDMSAATVARDADEVLALFRRCLAATRDPEGIRQILRMQELARDHH